jgi:hypothetical protein
MPETEEELTWTLTHQAPRSSTMVSQLLMTAPPLTPWSTWPAAARILDSISTPFDDVLM